MPNKLSPSARPPYLVSLTAYQSSLEDPKLRKEIDAPYDFTGVKLPAGWQVNGIGQAFKKCPDYRTSIVLDSFDYEITVTRGYGGAPTLAALCGTQNDAQEFAFWLLSSRMVRTAWIRQTIAILTLKD